MRSSARVDVPPNSEGSEAQNRLGAAQRHFGERAKKGGDKHVQPEREGSARVDVPYWRFFFSFCGCFSRSEAV